ncbi:hypothetical protein [Thalassococcus sp. S3]|uniref:hypothetical protein n=1 Tax=Thalassococcus sp. S3 TaxID=2017482 RepID=UPI00102B0406|nr:hypothetical protein [Thalassococcus sp. S3]
MERRIRFQPLPFGVVADADGARAFRGAGFAEASAVFGFVTRFAGAFAFWALAVDRVVLRGFGAGLTGSSVLVFGAAAALLFVAAALLLVAAALLLAAAAVVFLAGSDFDCGFAAGISGSNVLGAASDTFGWAGVRVAARFAGAGRGTGFTSFFSTAPIRIG